MNTTIFRSTTTGKLMQQVTKRTARKLWNKGETIYFQSSNMRFDNVWQQPMAAQKDGFSFVGYTFEQVCSSYESYNCDRYRGRYIHFFISI